jgi:cytochrome b
VNAGAAPPGEMVPVWDFAVRVLHWSLVLSVAAAWLTRHSPGRWHEWLGYATLAIVAARTAWGFIGAGHARFGEFMRSPAATAAYARSVVGGREARYLVHNPLGGWMVAALLAMVALVGFTGWLYTTDRFWGIAWVERLHSTLSDVLFVVVALHIVGVVFTSARHRENLLASMLHGRKRNGGAGHGPAEGR